ncbi:putative transmembrane protein [Toxoplasma gondii FOU]|uniref:Putative transmembrane protein n=2 Tax=Toxoplasma gondii TaxID=5811 RepID=A0A086LE68_TOXGO|nr:putative transmembrane protein [Toxoplasma gondii FOU]RQX69626.1 putative transmembrane protein [Toxoplasma gondii CAST]
MQTRVDARFDRHIILDRFTACLLPALMSLVTGLEFTTLVVFSVPLPSAVFKQRCLPARLFAPRPSPQSSLLTFPPSSSLARFLGILAVERTTRRLHRRRKRLRCTRERENCGRIGRDH